MPARLLLLALTAVVLFCGCVETSSMYGVHDANAHWTTVAEEPIPGVHAASVTNMRLLAGPEEGVQFVVWSDLANGGSGTGTGAMTGATYTGKHHGERGRRLNFSAETTDGVTGTVTIEGTRYEVSNGGLFLVSTAGDQPFVSQVRFDLTTIPKGSQRLMDFATRSPEITAFFKTRRSPDPAP